jgi:hypothetical protein
MEQCRGRGGVPLPIVRAVLKDRGEDETVNKCELMFLHTNTKKHKPHRPRRCGGWDIGTRDQWLRAKRKGSKNAAATRERGILTPSLGSGVRPPPFWATATTRRG